MAVAGGGPDAAARLVEALDSIGVAAGQAVSAGDVLIRLKAES